MMIKLNVLERFSIDGVMHHAGEVRLVSEEVAQVACSNGWAEDVDGKIPTGVRNPAAAKIEIHPVPHEHGATDAN